MVRKAKKRTSRKASKRNLQKKLLPILIILSVGVLILAVLAIIVMPIVNPGSRRGVGADGFQAFVEKNTTLHIDNAVSKSDVVEHLGKKAKSVGDVQVSAVFNLNGSRSQTATFPFVREDGVKSSLYVDLMFFKNQATINDARITTSTISAGTIAGHPAYFLRAQTLGAEREYRLMVVNGLKVYKFVIVQPSKNIKISEISALASLKKLAGVAKY